MVREVLDCLRPAPGELAVDCTLGGGGHAREILSHLQPGGRLIGLDVDPLELPRTEAALRQEGHDLDAFAVHNVSFAALPGVLAAERPADLILADLGVSAMQLDSPARGFNWKLPGPLDMRMNPSRGTPAFTLVERLHESELAALLAENADEPHAVLIARLLKDERPRTTQALERIVRTGLGAEGVAIARPEVKMSVRRTFQALRIAVNHELSALDALLRALPGCLAPGGRAVILTFHSGEDRRVKKAFQAGFRDGTYADVAREVIRSSMTETRANRRSSAAKLRWAVRSQPQKVR